jgi:hypothetical protein
VCKPAKLANVFQLGDFAQDTLVLGLGNTDLQYLAGNRRAIFDPVGHGAHVKNQVPNLTIEVILIDPPKI